MEVGFEMRKKVAELGRNRVPVAKIVKATGINRNTIVRWLHSEDIEPVLMRGEGSARPSGSLRNTPLALSIEESVRKRLAERERQEAEADETPELELAE